MVSCPVFCPFHYSDFDPAYYSLYHFDFFHLFDPSADHPYFDPGYFDHCHFDFFHLFDPSYRLSSHRSYHYFCFAHLNKALLKINYI